MEVKATAIKEVVIVTPKLFQDARGHFSETYVKSRFDCIDDIEFVQDNQSLSTHKHTIRGLHFQKPPFAQAKLVRVICGVVLDVAVDIRANSPTYGKYVGAILSAQNAAQLYVPIGFAHGFVTLEDNTIVSYKVSAPYNQQSEGGIIFDDESIAIDWGIARDQAILSDKDMLLPSFSSVDTVF
ncbi:MAG: dTDP-4-dehydrorhamnose 3 5-epimerase [Hyphomonadaceae bacterium]|nr:MAG: dTDP-4-dehydrorhamnose 3 5-epimerase [Hyphomonadaceae bacterium]KAF0183272.1 MAG: dTDP-4-dehydrorhamnose 3 5-epimerase [Hyphomonadaceae bacterium]